MTTMTRSSLMRVAEKFGLIYANLSFIKEKGFHHLEDFFRKTISKKRWGALCQPPRPAATMVVREFYANLAAHVLKKVRVRGVLVDFSAKSIKAYYNLEPVNAKPYDRLYVKTQTTPRSLGCSPMAKVSRS